MVSQSDFLQQLSRIEELIKAAGHYCIFYPKFHCELNFIKMYWGAAKRYARKNCAYDATGLRTSVPLALDSVSLVQIRRFARKSWRYMDAYRHGLSGYLAEFAIKQYRSHRHLPIKNLEDWENEYKQKEKKETNAK